jgi:hypothetical protein
LYIAATTQVISATLVVEQRRPGTSTRYSGWFTTSTRSSPTPRPTTIRYKKLLYAVLITKHKLRYYIESHPILVVTSFGLGEIVGNLLATGRITKWSLELMGLDTAYMPPNGDQVPSPSGFCG